MECKFEGQFNIVFNIPTNYELLVGIIDDPELEKIARVLIYGGTEVVPKKFYDVIPELGDYATEFDVFEIPSRDFLTATSEQFSYGWQNMLDRYLVQFKDPYLALCKLGLTIADQMKLVIQYHEWVKNGWIETTYKKLTGGSPNPLVDTGHMLNSIKYKVIVHNGSFN